METTENTTQQTTEKAVIDELSVRDALSSGETADEDFGIEMETDPSKVISVDQPTNTPDNQPSTFADNETPEPEKQPEVVPENRTTDTYAPSPIWDRIKSDYEKQLGEGTFKMPDDISSENEYDRLYQFFAENVVQPLDDIPTEAREIIELSQKGEYNPEEYFKQNSKRADLLSLPDKDFLFHTLKAENGKSDKNPDGWEDEDIDEFISKKTKIELHHLAKEKKDVLKQVQQQRASEHSKQQTELKAQQIEAANKSLNDDARKIVDQNKSSNSFFGIEFSPEDKQKFDRDFFEMLKIDPKEGQSKMNKLIIDNLYQIAGILWKGDGVKAYLTGMKESVKESIESKLDPTLEQQRGASKLPKTVDRGKLV